MGGGGGAKGGKKKEGEGGCLLRETGFVDAVVDVVVGPVVGGFDFLLEFRGEEVDFLIFFREDVVEFGVEHADDFARLGKGGWLAIYIFAILEFWSTGKSSTGTYRMYMVAYLIADDLALLDIVQSRDREATLVVGTDFEIDIP